ncbi:alkylated DNA repair protein alkB like protein 6 [Strigomonas culicis]|uniref:Alkylated DNA repair protein alkB like protein 6 n=1 Tax=Strigomonas culicis TaxID=28005 RepID=S9TXD1_9TRYP|nr:alkylated DNA repair protein alkB like protein 6 [Strigomonas culicis]|eukprot:EPY23117.1 alkylated DNA repair protein alkB like protein 6 [Strigomonas culicis]
MKRIFSVSQRCLPSVCGAALVCSPRSFQCSSVRRQEGATPQGGSKLTGELKSKGFINSTPNCSFDFTDSDTQPDLATDIVTEMAPNVSYTKDLHGPWLIMTDDLQGELFLDHDQFVYYRPANGIGYGIGTIEVLHADETGTAFTLTLESYTYNQTETIAPVFGLSFTATGMVKRVSSKSTNYETFSLVGVWQKTDRNQAKGDPIKPQKDSGETSVGQFNAAKLSPWNPRDAKPAWEPNAELKEVFRQIFPASLQLQSHIARAEAQRSAEPAAPRAAEKPHHLQLEKYAVGSIPGIYYIPDYVSPEEEARIAENIRKTPGELKTQLKKRTVQEWGCTMCDQCEKSFVSDANMPHWVQECTDMLVYDGIFTPTTFPNSVRIHEYQPGEGIGPHCDGPIYVPVVTVLSLASTCVMNFYPRREPYADAPMDHYNDTFKFTEGSIGSQTPVQSVVMEPGSLLIFSGEAYYYYPHGVSDKEVSDLSPEVSGPVVNRHLLKDPDVASVTRSYRSSITTRNLLTRCNHQTERAEYAMKRAWHLYHQKAIPESLFTPAALQDNDGALAKDGAAVGAATSEPLRSPVPSSLSATTHTAALEQKMNELLQQQKELQSSLEELKQIMAISISQNANFQKETSTVLNNLSKTILELDSKMEDIEETLEDSIKKA